MISKNFSEYFYKMSLGYVASSTLAIIRVCSV